LQPKISTQVELRAANAADGDVLANLLELYAHDLSAVFDLEVGEDGRYGYPRLPLYWSEAERRHAFLIREKDRIAGFALITRGSPISTDPNCWDMSEFFVLRPYRRRGIGEQAVQTLWRDFPGPWTVRVAEANAGAVDFWSKAVAAQTLNRYVRHSQVVAGRSWSHFLFTST
jgi:predicted acetyltransferase